MQQLQNSLKSYALTTTSDGIAELSTSQLPQGQVLAQEARLPTTAVRKKEAAEPSVHNLILLASVLLEGAGSWEGLHLILI